MRGKHCSIDNLEWVSGITPAYAGKTEPFSRINLLEGDHPRVCGENTIKLHFSDFFTGSPPQVRGKLLRSFS